MRYQLNRCYSIFQVQKQKTEATVKKPSTFHQISSVSFGEIVDKIIQMNFLFYEILSFRSV